MTEAPQVLYRYDVDYTGSLLLTEYPVLKTTPCGFWVQDERLPDGKRYVMRDSNRSYCKTTLEAAKASFLIRKEKYVANCENRLFVAKHQRSVALALKEGWPIPRPVHQEVLGLGWPAFADSLPTTPWDPTT